MTFIFVRARARIATSYSCLLCVHTNTRTHMQIHIECVCVCCFALALKCIVLAPCTFAIAQIPPAAVASSSSSCSLKNTTTKKLQCVVRAWDFYTHRESYSVVHQGRRFYVRSCVREEFFFVRAREDVSPILIRVIICRCARGVQFKRDHWPVIFQLRFVCKAI